MKKAFSNSVVESVTPSLDAGLQKDGYTLAAMSRINGASKPTGSLNRHYQPLLHQLSLPLLLSAMSGDCVLCKPCSAVVVSMTVCYLPKVVSACMSLS